MLSTNNKMVQSGQHCVYNLHVHLVFVTKYRRAVFTKAMIENMQQVFETICQRLESTLIECNGEKDHVHLLVHYPPKLCLSKLVHLLKGTSSRIIRTHYKAQLSTQVYGDSLWSESYFAGSCGGAPIDIVRQYIKNQKSPQT